MEAKYKWLAGGALLLIYQATIGGGFGNLQAQMQQGQQTRQQRQTDNESTQARQIALDKLKQQAPIANARYAAGCQLIVSNRNDKESSAIGIGEPVLVGKTTRPLAIGNLVCDGNGFTAEIIAGTYQGKPTPVAGLEARTLDQSVIQGAIERYKNQGINIKQNAQ